MKLNETECVNTFNTGLSTWLYRQQIFTVTYIIILSLLPSLSTSPFSILKDEGAEFWHPNDLMPYDIKSWSCELA